MDAIVEEKREWSIHKLIERSAAYLEDKGIDEARLNCELLLCHVLNCGRIDLYIRFDAILQSEELAKFKSLLKRRLMHEPLQYIIGTTDFMGLRFKVDSRVLIPRPETELLVEQVIAYAETKSYPDLKILDIGTGSGCIAVSLAKLIKNSKVDAIDCSTQALDAALENIKAHNLEDRISLIHSDILKDNVTGNRYDIVASNPPYISLDEFEKLQPEIKDHEPSFANTDYADGLTFYKVIAEKGKQLLKIGGCVFTETAFDQNAEVVRIFREAGYENIETFRDYSGIDRVVKANRE